MRAPLAIALVLAACTGEPPRGGAVARFDVSAETIDQDDAPFPGDFRRDAEGRIRLGAFPTARTGTTLFTRLRGLLEARSGFCGTCGVTFPIDGALDRSSIPHTTEGRAGDPVILVDVTEGSPTRGARVPLRIDWREDLGMIVARPARGVVLRGTWAAAITTAIRAEDGSALAASPSFDRAARTAELAAAGIDAASIVSATTFTVEDPTIDLRAARALVLAAPAPVITVDRVWHAGSELDDLLGEPSEDRPGIDVPPAAGTEGTASIRHGSIALVIAGRLTAPRVVTGAGTDVGELRRDAAGALEAGPLEDVPFVLSIPAGADLAALPILVHHHGFNASRVTGFVLADTAARAGVAVISIDAFQHGARAASARDELHAVRGTGVAGADGLAETSLLDVTGRVFGLTGVPDGEELFAGYPLGAFVQFASDAIATVRCVRESDLAPLRAADPSLAALAFGRVDYAGNSMGSVVGTSVLAVEPAIDLAILDVPPGSIVENLVESPEFRPLTLSALLPRLGVEADFDEIDHHLALDPVIDLFRWALEPIDPLALAPELRGRDVIFQVAALDEVASPPATRSFLAAAEATQVTIYDPAAHGMLEVLDQRSRYEPPHDPPLIERETELTFANPIAAVHAEIEAALAR